jgi:hypothetical protein
MPRGANSVFGTIRIRAGESRASEPCSCSIRQARDSKVEAASRLPADTTSAHASSAIACRVRSAATSSQASPLRTRAMGVSRRRVTAAQLLRISSGSSARAGRTAHLQPAAAVFVCSFQSVSGGHPAPSGGATANRYASVWSRTRLERAKTSGGHSTSRSHAGPGPNVSK